MNNFNSFERNVVDLNTKRSRFPMDHGHKTTFTSGRLIPFDVVETLPGDTFSWDTFSLTRLLTPKFPTMDNAYLDLYAFFVPFRLCTKDEKDWPRITGENFDGPWVNSQEYTLANTGNLYSISSCGEMSILNYMGLGIAESYSSGSKSVNAMPLRGFFRIWNEFFRDQNTMSPIDLVDPFSEDIQPEESSQYLPVSKYHDYFTSASLAPQKANSGVPLMYGMAPVVTGNNHDIVNSPLRWNNLDSNTNKSGVLTTNTTGNTIITGNSTTTTSNRVVPQNLWADLSASTVSNINDLRFAFGLQSILERRTYGTRYRETIKNEFGISIPDGLVQVPQYLGGKHIPININQVANTSSNLGETGAFSLTADSTHMFTKSFVERGYIFIVGCVRTDNTYAYGCPKFLSAHKTRYYDYYHPLLANLGDMPIYRDEIFSDSNIADVFGYNEAWAEYRFIPNKVTGLLAPNSSESSTFMAWTYTEKFDDSPVLAESFIKANKDTLGQTLSDTSTLCQIIVDLEFKITATRPMPLFSIPALLGRW